MHQRSILVYMLDSSSDHFVSLLLGQHHGSTDKQVLINTLAHYGVPPSQSEPKVPEATEKMLEYARLHPEEVSLGLEILTGVAALLRELHSRKNVLIGLVSPIPAAVVFRSED